jgi:hypothetical protein
MRHTEMESFELLLLLLIFFLPRPLICSLVLLLLV